MIMQGIHVVIVMPARQLHLISKSKCWAAGQHNSGKCPLNLCRKFSIQRSNGVDYFAGMIYALGVMVRLYARLSAPWLGEARTWYEPRLRLEPIIMPDSE